MAEECMCQATLCYLEGYDESNNVAILVVDDTGARISVPRETVPNDLTINQSVVMIVTKVE